MLIKKKDSSEKLRNAKFRFLSEGQKFSATPMSQAAGVQVQNLSDNSQNKEEVKRP